MTQGSSVVKKQRAKENSSLVLGRVLWEPLFGQGVAKGVPRVTHKNLSGDATIYKKEPDSLVVHDCHPNT